VSESSRRRTSVALVALTAVLVAATALCGYVRWEIVDGDRFSRRAAAALDSRTVRVVMAERLVDALTASAAPNVLVVRPVAVAGVAALADSSRFRRAFARAVRSRHGALMEGRESFVLELLPDDRLLSDLARLAARKASTLLGRELDLRIAGLDPRAFELRLARGLADFAAWWWPLCIATLLAGGALVATARSVRDAIARLGAAVAAAGLAVAAVVAGTGAFVAAHAARALDLVDETERAAVGAVWAALFGDLRTSGLVAAVGGAIVATVASGDELGRWLAAVARASRRALRTPGPWARRARAVIAIGLGVALLLEPALMIRLGAVVGGGLLALLGIVLLTGRAGGAEDVPVARAASPAVLGATVGGVTVVTAAVVAFVLPPPKPTPAAPADPAACNGAVALCDRRLDEVVFPSTHNSYAAAREPQWFFANQTFGIGRQLRDGIRGFLVDLHYGVRAPGNGRVRTDLQAEGSSRNKVARELSPEALRTADRLAGRVGAGELGGPSEPFFCHTLCELGAEPAAEQWQLFADFLAANPREVLVVFIEPYVAVEEIERGLADAGLLEQAAELRRDRPLPTLGELIAARTRLVVLAEEDGGARPWYLDGFSFAQDTPYQATRPSELSCRRFRGLQDSPLLLINHWIATFPPSPVRNQRIGGPTLRRRLADCERDREQLPNLVAVDFYERSDVLRIAQALNAR
jgi:hypothetical protein